MSAAHDLIYDTVLKALDRGPLKCLHCSRVRNLCICLEFCEVCAELQDVCDDCWDSGLGRDDE